MVNTKINKSSLNLAIIFYILVNIITIVKTSSNETRIINYYNNDGKIYSIEEKENSFTVVIKQQIFCIRAPCIPPIIDEIPIKEKEDCEILRVLFDENFKDNNIKEKYVFDDDINDEQVEIIIKVLLNNKIISRLEYEIINSLNQYDIKHRERGYFYEIEDECIIYTIAMGEQASSGYSIGVKKIKIKGNSATIYVTEKVPGKGEVVTDALTYPIVQVKFNQFPSRITILNYETGERFRNLI